MNIAALYSLTSGQKLNKIHTFEKYFSLPFENYIVIQPWSKPSKNYSYWNSVLDILYPILEKTGLKIVQIGGPNEPVLKYCYNTAGLTNWGQLQFIISHAKLVLSTDSVSAHLAGHYNIPLVDLISNNFKECVSPYFGDKTKQIILEPDRTNKNPLFSLDEGQKQQINEIKPEEVAGAVCQLLNLNFNYPYKTIYVGHKFNSNIMVEMVPNQAIQLQGLGIDNIMVRMDYLFNESALVHQAQLGNISIITDKPINIDILKQFKPRIKELVYFVTKQNNPEFVKQAQRVGLNVVMVSELPIEELTPIKFHYMDYGIIHHKPKTTKDKLDFLKDKNLSKLYYQSNKITLSSGKCYASKAAWLQEKPLKGLNMETQPIIDSPAFWNETEVFWLTTI